MNVSMWNNAYLYLLQASKSKAMMNKSEFAQMVRTYLDAREFSEFDARRGAEKTLKKHEVSGPQFETIMLKLDDEWTVCQLHYEQKKQLGTVSYAGWGSLVLGGVVTTMTAIWTTLYFVIPIGMIAIGGLVIFMVKNRLSTLESEMDLREYEWKKWFQNLDWDS